MNKEDAVLRFKVLEELAVEGSPVGVYVTGATISQKEGRQIKQYHGNDYFTSYNTDFGRPVNITDIKGMSEVNRKMSLLMSLATQVNRKQQARDGIKAEVGPDISVEFSYANSTLVEGKVLPGKEVDAIRAQLTEFRKATDAVLNPNQEVIAQPLETAPAAPVKAKTVRKRKATPAPVPPAPADDGGMGMPIEEVN
jgi:hypothetical protein